MSTGDVHRHAVGVLLLGWVTTRLAEPVAPTRNCRYLLGAGLCGALPTFQIETIQMARNGYPGTETGCAAASLALSMAWAGSSGLVAALGAIGSLARFHVGSTRAGRATSRSAHSPST